MDIPAILCVVTRADELLRLIVDQADEMLFLQDRDQRYEWVVHPVAAFGDPAAILGHDDGALLGPAGEAIAARKERVLEEGHELHDEISLEVDGALRTYELVCRPRRTERGTITGIFGILRDITTRRREEQAIAEAQREESLALLAGGVAHDLNNLLQALSANLTVARLEADGQEALNAPLDRAETVVTAAAGLAHQLLAYAGRDAAVRRVVDLHRAAEDAASALGPALGAGVVVRVVATAGEVRVEGDPTQIAQVILNLLRNAADALAPSGGAVLLRAGRSTYEPSRAGGWWLSSPLRRGRYALLEVADDGPGVPPEVLERLFVPFFSTKATGRGLGLAAAAGIARSHGGAIAVRSKPGYGATFRLLLPALDVEPARLPRPRLLYVEDDAAVRIATEPLLKHFGYGVVACADAGTALAALRADPDGYAAIVADIVLGGTSGAELAVAAREVRRDLPIVLSSGWSGRTVPEIISTIPGARFVPKPAPPNEMARAIALAITDPCGDGAHS